MSRVSTVIRIAFHSPLFVSVLVLALASVVGCKPNRSNVTLRKKNQQLQGKITELQRRHKADEATIRGLQTSSENLATPTLPPERLGELFTAHGLRFGKLTGGADLDREKPGHEGIKVYVVPTDQTGDVIKAAGSFVVEAFDLAQPEDARLGRWEFDRDRAGKTWNSFLNRYEYVLTCPWQKPPSRPEVTLKTTFTDALTGRQFVKQRVVKVAVPVAAPATAANAPD